MNKIFVILLFVVTACGYQPLYKLNENIDKLNISKIELVGNKQIGKKIFSKLPFKLDKNDKSLNILILDSNKNTIEASKNSKGQITSYKSTLIVNLKILNSKNVIVEKKYLQKEFYYNTNENKFKLKEYQNKIEENLINSIVDDIIIYLNYL